MAETPETPIVTPIFSLFVYVSIKAREMRGGGGEEERGRGRGTAKGESNNYGILTDISWSRDVILSWGRQSRLACPGCDPLGMLPVPRIVVWLQAATPGKCHVTIVK